MRENKKTNLPDWSALMPVLPQAGVRAQALYEALRRLIETGAAPPGAKLPPTRDLTKRLKLSRTAAVAAYERLTAEGFAEARVGAGTFVAAAVPRLDAPLTMPSAPVAEEAALPGQRPLALGVAAPDPRTLAVFRRLIAQDLARPSADLFRYGDPRGGIALRRAIAAYLQTARGVRCAPEQILVTAGTQQGLDLVLRSVLTPGDAVLVEDPCYPSALAAVRGAGGRPVPVPVDAEGLDPDRIPAMDRVKAVYVTPSHQFPLGVTMSMRRRLALIDWARKAGAVLIEDDYDSEFRYAGAPLAALQGMDASGSVAYLGTFSKVLFPGLRTGYAVIPERLLSQVVALRMTADRQPPGLTERALARLLDEGHFAAHLKRARRRAEKGRDLLVAALAETCGPMLSVACPAQGLHLVARFSRFGPEEAGGDAACAYEGRIAAATGLRPLSPMYVGPPRDQGLVLGFSGFTEATIRQAAETLATALAAG